MKTLLIDGNSLLNRAFYGIRPLSTKEGVPTNGVFGFMNILFKLLADVAPERACVAFDLKQPTFRHKMYAEYKAGRHPTPDELLAQFPVLKELLDAYGIPRREVPGYEADDIIGTLADKLGGEVFIATGDRDSLQLVSGRVTVLLAGAKVAGGETMRCDPAKINELYGVEPKQLRDVKGLMGDSSDNIPGVKGVGEKTACDLIRRYSDLEGVYANIGEQKGALREKLERDRDAAFMSRELGTICLEAPVEYDPDAYLIKPYDPATLAAALKKYELEKFIDKLGLQNAAPAEAAPSAPAPEAEEADAGAFAAALSARESADVYLDFTAGEAALCGGTPLICRDLDGAVRALSAYSGRLRVNDYKRLCRACAELSLPAPRAEFCAAIGGYLLRPDRSDYSVFALARLLGLPRAAKEDSAAAASLLPAVCDAEAAELEADGMTALMRDMELPLARVLTDMERAGFTVDVAGLQAFGAELSARAEAAQTEIYRLAGCEFNVNSPKQLGDVLFNRLGLRGGKKTKTGWSTDAETLGKLRGESEIVDLVLEYRTLTKLVSTYVVGLSEAAGEDGRVHTTFLQTETRTGRISSREPNLQNIPVRTELGSNMRRFFRAADGCVLVDADYSQIELRLLAALSGDENMIAAFLSGNDFHRETAARVFGLPADMVTPEIRGRAKAINFGIVYGMGAFTLSKDLKISVYDAKKYIENYFATYPKVREWLDASVASAKESGYARTALGRRRRLEGINGTNAVMRNFEERVAMNMPVQGTAADVIKLAMVNTAKKLRECGFKARLILQVHDELIVEAPEAEAEAVGRLLKEEMENAYKCAVPLIAEVGVGKTWYEAK
ncbi:MAG: DNA polymerase I [Clostridia bacterium]|nr:DNA polymerase I [Clostridia bacterium]